MNLDVEALFQKMLSVGAASFGAEWSHVRVFAPAEFKKLAIQLVDIADNVERFEADPSEGFPPETAAVLLRMQRRAIEATLTAVTALTLISIQNAFNAILKIIKDTFGGVLATFL